LVHAYSTLTGIILFLTAVLLNPCLPRPSTRFARISKIPALIRQICPNNLLISKGQKHFPTLYFAVFKGFPSQPPKNFPAREPPGIFAHRRFSQFTNCNQKIPVDIPPYTQACSITGKNILFTPSLFILHLPSMFYLRHRPGLLFFAPACRLKGLGGQVAIAVRAVPFASSAGAEGIFSATRASFFEHFPLPRFCQSNLFP